MSAGSTGAVRRPARQSFSRSMRKPRWMPTRPVKTKLTHRSAGAAAGVGSCATVKTTTRSTPSTKTLARLSRVRHSMRRSFNRMASAPRTSGPPHDDGLVGRGDDHGLRRALLRPGDAPAMKDGEPGRNRRGALEVVRGEHDGVARGAQLAETALQRRQRHGVVAGEGLVEEEEVRLVQQRAREREAPRHAARVGTYRPASGR